MITVFTMWLTIFEMFETQLWKFTINLQKKLSFVLEKNVKSLNYAIL